MKNLSKLLLFTSILLIFCIANVSATDIDANDMTSDTTIHAEHTIQQTDTNFKDSKTGNAKEIIKTNAKTRKEAAQTINITKNNYNQYFETNESGKVKTTDNVKTGDTLNLQGTFNDLEFISDKENVAITSIGKNAKLIDCTVILQGPNNQKSSITNLTINNTKKNCEGIILNNVTNVYVANNKVYVSGSDDFAFTSSTMKHSIVENNYFESSHTQTTMRIYGSDNNQILNNSLQGYANGIYLCAYGDETSNNNTIKYNTVVGKSPASTCYTIQLMGSDNLVEENTVSGGFRGISSENSNIIRNNDVNAANTGIFTGENSTIENNYVHVTNNSIGMSIKGSNSIVRNNIIECNETGISIDVNDLTITNNTINSKKYAIYSKGYPKAYTGININKNTIIGQVYNTGTMTLTANTIKNAEAKDGGAIYNTGTMTASDNIITANTATANGGAIYNSGTLTLNNNNITKNSATSGAIVYMKKGKVTASKNIFVNNTPASFEFKNDKITMSDTGNFIPTNAQVSIYEKSSLVKTVSMKDSIIDYTIPSGNHTYYLIVTNTSDSFDKNNFTFDYKELKRSVTTASVTNKNVNNVALTVKVTDKTDTSKTLAGKVTVYDQRNEIVGTGTLNNGVSTIKLSNLDYSLDSCNLNVEYDGSSTYFKSQYAISNLKFIREQTKIAISLSKRTVQNTVIKATLTSVSDSKKLSDKTVILTLPDKSKVYSSTDKNGVATFNINSFTAGSKKITCSSEKEILYDATSTTKTVNILKETSKMSVAMQSKTTKNSTVKVTLTSPSTGKAIPNAYVNVSLGSSKKKVKTDANGIAIATFSNINSGSVKLTANYYGNGTYNTSAITKTVSISKAASVTTVKSSNNTVRFVTLTGTVKDKLGKNINEGSVVAKIGSKTVSSKVNVKNGKYTLKLKIDRTGKYNVSVCYSGSKYYAAKNVTLKNLNVVKIGSKFTSVKKVGSTVGYTNITAILKDANGKAIANAKINIKNSKGKILKTAKTNKNGKIATPVTLSSGTQTLTVQYAGNNTYKSVSSKLKVTVKKNDVTVKVSKVSGSVGKKVKLTATVKDSNGNAVTSGNLVFKLNGKVLKKDLKFNSTKAAYKISVKNGKVTVTVTADLYMSLNKKLTASYTGNSKYNNANSATVSCNIAK